MQLLLGLAKKTSPYPMLE
jgi:hypothetical protein